MRDHDAVLFDLDGVLLDSRAAFVQCINTALQENGLAPREAGELYRYLGPPLHQAFATAKAQAVAEPLLEALGLRAFFTAVLGPGLDTEDESKEETIARALTHFARDAQPVMVGDRGYDVAAAHANAMPAIGVLWGIGSEQELSEAGADALVETPAELADVLRAHRR